MSIQRYDFYQSTNPDPSLKEKRQAELLRDLQEKKAILLVDQIKNLTYRDFYIMKVLEIHHDRRPSGGYLIYKEVDVSST